MDREEMRALKAKIAVYKKQWLREHAWQLALCFIAYFALCAFLPLIALVGYAFMHNRMMRYVEKRAFSAEEKKE